MKRRLSFNKRVGINDSEDTRKEQLHLMPGSPEYQEYIRDKQKLDEENFIADDKNYDFGDDKRPDDEQKSETVSKEVAEHATVLRDKNYDAFRRGGQLGYNKYRAQLLKESDNKSIVNEALALAEQKKSMVTKKDYKRSVDTARKLVDCKKIKEYAEDISVTQDEYDDLSLSYFDDLI